MNPWTTRALQAACLLTLVGLGLQAYALLVPRPLPIIVALSVGQGIGTLAFVVYLSVFIYDLRRRRVLTRRPTTNPPSP